MRSAHASVERITPRARSHSWDGAPAPSEPVGTPEPAIPDTWIRRGASILSLRSKSCTRGEIHDAPARAVREIGAPHNVNLGMGRRVTPEPFERHSMVAADEVRNQPRGSRVVRGVP